MTGKHNNASEQTGPNTSAGAWGLRYPGLVMSTAGKNEVKEFTGMWRLKPDADLVAFTEALAPRGPWIWARPGELFSVMTTMLGLDPNGPLVRRQDAGLRRIYPVLHLSVRWDSGQVLRRLRSQWEGQPVKDLGPLRRLPDRPGCDSAGVVEYIARGQIKTLACYDVAPGLSIGQIYKTADWYEKTLKFQRALAKGDGKLEDKVNAFLKELAEPYNPVLSAAMIDTDVSPPVAVRGYRRTGESVQSGDRSVNQRTLRRPDRPWHHVEVISSKA